jgi:uncharacterized protein
VGSILARHLTSQGHDVVVLTRNKRHQPGAGGARDAVKDPSPWRHLLWDGEKLGTWVDELEGADAVINLAGRSVDCRYGSRNRLEILHSRIQTTALIGEAIPLLKHPPRLWMNASTATIYRHSLDREMDEATGEIGGNESHAPSTWRFSIEVATRWEQTFFRAKTPNTRKIALRSAMVMSPDHGGVFEKLLRLVRLGLGGSSGSGKQFVSWIHDVDFVRAIDFLIAHDQLDGPVNVASPGPLPNNEFMSALRDAWETRVGLPAAEWMLEMGAFFLRTETELILKSRRVVPGRLREAGFCFVCPEWRSAARELALRWRERRIKTSGHEPSGGIA